VRLFVPPDELSGEAVTIEGEGHRHLARSLRAAVGDAVTVFDGRGTEIEARIERVGRRATVLSLGRRRVATTAPEVDITLLQGLARGDRMDAIVQKTTELGVARIVPVITLRSAPAAAAATAARLRRWLTIAREAARQSERADVPAILPPVPLADALARPLSDPTDVLRLALWEESRGPGLGDHLERVRSDKTPPPVILLVGPEGGFAVEEIDGARAAGFTVASLGRRVLRVETAAMVAVALVQAAAGGLG